MARVHVQRPQQISTRRVLASQPRCRQCGVVVGIEVIGLLLEDSGERRQRFFGPLCEKVDPGLRANAAAKAEPAVSSWPSLRRASPVRIQGLTLVESAAADRRQACSRRWRGLSLGQQIIGLLVAGSECQRRCAWRTRPGFVDAPRGGQCLPQTQASRHLWRLGSGDPRSQLFGREFIGWRGAVDLNCERHWTGSPAKAEPSVRSSSHQPTPHMSTLSSIVPDTSKRMVRGPMSESRRRPPRPPRANRP